LNDEGRLAQFRYTAGRARDAGRIVQRRASYLKARRGEHVPGVTICPSCGAVIQSADGVCKACNPDTTPQRGSSPLRLGRYARRRWRLILVGFVLTLASTAASLVPINLTRYLLDDLLIPYQSGEEVEFSLVWLYLAALVVAALLTWLLDWGRIL